jgi:hypothetical protein
VKAICRWGVQEPSGAVPGNSVRRGRALGPQQRRCRRVAEAHYELVLRTYWRWLSTASASERKTFTLMPFFKVKRHYIQVDSRVLRHPLRKRCLQRRQTNSKTRRLKGSADSSGSTRSSCTVGGSGLFTGTVTTDGVTVITLPGDQPGGSARGFTGLRRLRTLTVFLFNNDVTNFLSRIPSMPE